MSSLEESFLTGAFVATEDFFTTGGALEVSESVSESESLSLLASFLAAGGAFTGSLAAGVSSVSLSESSGKTLRYKLRPY